MFAIIIGLIVIALVVTLLLKGYYQQANLIIGGVVLTVAGLVKELIKK